MGHVSESGTSLDLSHISTDLATLMPYAFPDARPCSGGCSAIFCSEKVRACVSGVGVWGWGIGTGRCMVW